MMKSTDRPICLNENGILDKIYTFIKGTTKVPYSDAITDLNKCFDCFKKAVNDSLLKNFIIPQDNVPYIFCKEVNNPYMIIMLVSNPINMYQLGRDAELTEDLARNIVLDILKKTVEHSKYYDSGCYGYAKGNDAVKYRICIYFKPNFALKDITNKDKEKITLTTNEFFEQADELAPSVIKELEKVDKKIGVLSLDKNIVNYIKFDDTHYGRVLSHALMIDKKIKIETADIDEMNEFNNILTHYEYLLDDTILYKTNFMISTARTDKDDYVLVLVNKYNVDVNTND